ncbi:hypothetical protein J6590_096707 [Homalodisca vitripennis]|nr:hypothetical protein J6590_096707 [Homalodisca vitripennis]
MQRAGTEACTDIKGISDQYFPNFSRSRARSSTFSDTRSLWSTWHGTRSRREHLKQCKFFDCECKRCQDPTELGTHVSSLRCECGSGHLVPTEPLSLDSTWRCDNDQCHASLAATEVDTVVTRYITAWHRLSHSLLA